MIHGLGMMNLTKDRTAVDESYLEKIKRVCQWHGAYFSVMCPACHINEKFIALGKKYFSEREELSDCIDVRCECGKKISLNNITRYYSFNIGSAAKYLLEFNETNNHIESLIKASCHIQDEIEKLTK